MKRVLVVDDEVGTRQSLNAIFSGTYDVSLAENAEMARRILSGEPVDLILLDVSMPDKDGISFLKDLQGIYPEVPVVMISALTSVKPVVEAMRGGAYDYVSKPFDVQEILRVARRAIDNSMLHRQVESLQTDVFREFPVNNIVGRSSAFLAALDDIRKAADTDATVLIHGESGTGKELAARLLHRSSARREEPFVAVHCASLSENLMESELFGHEKGAFTGADQQKPGRFDLAGSGTLFFDEVSEMTSSTQVKLLRVLQEREFMRVGGTRVIPTTARIVAATAKDLKNEVEKGRFRDDLYYRLSVVPAFLPPLRERQGDIPLLARHFLSFFRDVMDARVEGFEESAMELLEQYVWSGNVRELRNIVERLVVLHRRERLIKAEHLPDDFDHSRSSANVVMPSIEDKTLEEAVGAFEKLLLDAALRATGGVQTRAAKRLGTTRRILRYKMQRYGLESSAYLDQQEG